MTVEKIKEQIDKEKVIAIVRGVSTEKCMKVAEALYEGGIRLMEVPFNPKDPHLAVLIHADINQCILQRMFHRIEHSFCQAIAKKFSFIWNHLADPVCLQFF